MTYSKPDTAAAWQSRAPFTVPSDLMRDTALRLLRDGSVTVQGLADALAQEGTPAKAVTIAELLLKATQANMRKAT